MNDIIKDFVSIGRGQNMVSHFEQVELDTMQSKKWEDTLAMLMWTCPAFTHILFSMMDNGISKNTAVFTRHEQIKTAATDGINLVINPDFFFALPAAKRLFVVAHEIMHCVLNHPGMDFKLKQAAKVWVSETTHIPYDGMAMNVAEDYIINDMLVTAQIGEIDDAWLYNKGFANENDDRISIYQKLFKDKKPSGGVSFDIILDPGAATGQDPSTIKHDKMGWDNALAAGVAIGKATGRMPANIEQLFEKLLEPVVDWTDKIQSFFSRKVGSGGYDWRKPDRRLIVRDIYAPGRTGFGAGTVVVAIDTSGSIYGVPKLLDRFLAELGGILTDVRPKRLCVAWCDAYVHRVDEPEDLGDVGGLKPIGGGGTNFIPVFDWIEENVDECDALVYLTDGQGTFPNRAPKYPVLWGDIAGSEYPFGEVVEIPRK